MYCSNSSLCFQTQENLTASVSLLLHARSASPYVLSGTDKNLPRTSDTLSDILLFLCFVPRLLPYNYPKSHSLSHSLCEFLLSYKALSDRHHDALPYAGPDIQAFPSAQIPAQDLLSLLRYPNLSKTACPEKDTRILTNRLSAASAQCLPPQKVLSAFHIHGIVSSPA